MAANDRHGLRSALETLTSVKALDAEIVGSGFRPPARAPALPPPVPPAAAADPLALFDQVITEPDLSAATRPLYRDGHFARAVEEGFKFLNNAVKGRSGDTTRDGQALMLNTFSDTTPVLRLNRLRRQSEKDEQKGYAFIYAGTMTGIRNPRAHEHDLRDDPDVALEMLVIANHLTRMLRRSSRPRARRARP
jgi:uncharacterized protein (TIGR02391 family)